MRFTRKDLDGQLECIARIFPVPEGLEWTLDNYMPGGERLYRLEVVNKLGLGCEPFGYTRRTAREMHHFMSGVIQGMTQDVTAQIKELAGNLEALE